MFEYPCQEGDIDDAGDGEQFDKDAKKKVPITQPSQVRTANMVGPASHGVPSLGGNHPGMINGGSHNDRLYRGQAEFKHIGDIYF